MLRAIFSPIFGALMSPCCAENGKEGLKIGDFQKQEAAGKKAHSWRTLVRASCAQNGRAAYILWNLGDPAASRPLALTKCENKE